MSTLDGHSALQALHSRQRSITSYKPFAGELLLWAPAPRSRFASALARPRVECSSSRVPMYDGHMVPSSFLRHSPMPLHISTARAKPPWPLKSNVVRGSHGLVVRADLQRLGHRRRVDDLAGVHRCFRIEGPLDLAEAHRKAPGRKVSR